MMKELSSRGISAAAIKHLGRHYEPDDKKDTGRLFAAEMSPVVGVAEGETVIRLKGGRGLQESICLVERLADTDVIFVEGFKHEPIEKIAVGDIEDLPGTKFRAEQFDEIVEYIDNVVNAERASRDPCGCKKASSKGGEGLSDVNIKIVVNGKKLPANEFVQNMFWETLCGMVRALKGVEKDVDSIEISASKE